MEIVFDDNGTLIAAVVDATTTEVHRSSAVATDQEIERGAAITDHVRPERATLSATVVISDTPIGPTAALGGSVQSVVLDDKTKARASIFVPDVERPTRTVDTWRLLKDALERALLATVTTRLEQYFDMVLVDLEVTRTAADGSAIEVELLFKSVALVATELVTDPVAARPRDRRQQQRGAQPTEEASPRLQSIWSRGVEALTGGLFGA